MKTFRIGRFFDGLGQGRSGKIFDIMAITARRSIEADTVEAIGSMLIGPKDFGGASRAILRIDHVHLRGANVSTKVKPERKQQNQQRLVKQC